jgi:hypothetical protein
MSLPMPLSRITPDQDAIVTEIEIAAAVYGALGVIGNPDWDPGQDHP